MSQIEGLTIVLDDRIDSMAEILQQQYSIPVEDFTNPSRVSPVLLHATSLTQE